MHLLLCLDGQLQETKIPLLSRVIWEPDVYLMRLESDWNSMQMHKPVFLPKCVFAMAKMELNRKYIWAALLGHWLKWLFFDLHYSCSLNYASPTAHVKLLLTVHFLILKYQFI